VKGRCRTINKDEGLLAKIAGVERDIAENIIIPQHDIINGFSFFGGGHAFFRKKIFEEIGYFDESIMCEDIDYSIKIHKAGYNIRVDPTVISWEESPADFNQWWHQRKRWSRGWIQCALTHIRSIPGHPKFSTIKKLDTLYYLIITIMLPTTLLLYPSGILSYLGFSPETFYPGWFITFVGIAIAMSSMFAFAAVQYKDYKRGEKVRWREIPVIFELVVYMPLVLFVSWVGWVDEFLLNSEKEYVKTMRSGVNSGKGG
jgi:cellulose synthase/poly-beta-1,6-N-acetylglucosamine synthase-like glycosyltransferase